MEAWEVIRHRSERELECSEGFGCLCSDGYVFEVHICWPVYSQVQNN